MTDEATGQEHTSACFLANSEPSASRFCIIPSTLLELNSLKGGKHQHGFRVSAGYLNVPSFQLIRKLRYSSKNTFFPTLTVDCNAMLSIEFKFKA